MDSIITLFKEVTSPERDKNMQTTYTVLTNFIRHFRNMNVNSQEQKKIVNNFCHKYSLGDEWCSVLLSEIGQS